MVVFVKVMHVVEVTQEPQMTCVEMKFNNVRRSDTATVHSVSILMRLSYREVDKANGRLLVCVNHIWRQPVCLSPIPTRIS